MAKRTLKEILKEQQTSVEQDTRTPYEKFKQKPASPVTKDVYEKVLERFRQFCGAANYDALVYKDTENKIQYEPKVIQRMCQLYLKELTNDGLRRPSVLMQLWALAFFYQKCNDIVCNWELLSSEIPKERPLKQQNEDEDEEYQKAEMYTVPEQQQMIAVTRDPRDRAVVPFTGSTGVRAGAFEPLYNEQGELLAPGLQIRHIHKIKDLLPEDHPILSQYPDYKAIRMYSGYLVQVYADTPDEYFTFTSPEAARLLDIYHQDRVMRGEVLKMDSPLFREIFYSGNKEKANNPTYASAQALQMTMQRLQRRIGMRPKMKAAMSMKELLKSGKPGRIRRRVKVMHGFRKFTDTMMTNSGVDPEFRKLMMGHDCGLQENYYDYKQPESVYRALTEYLKAVPYLTLDEQERLRAKLEYSEMQNKELRESLEGTETLVKMMIKRQEATEQEVKQLKETSAAG